MTVPLRVTLVTAPNCHLCAHAREVLSRLSEEHSIVVTETEWDEPSGQRLVARDGVPFPPALYAGDELLGYGRISERRLRRQFARYRTA